MQIDLSGSEFCLHSGQPLSLSHARGCRLRCTAGILWITVPGLVEDVFLESGDEFTVPDQGRVLVEAVDRARLMVNPQSHPAANRGYSLAGCLDALATLPRFS